MRRYIEHSVAHKHLAGRIPDFEGTRTVTASSAVFVAERERKILQLRFFDGLTQSQIAQQVGLSQMHVSRLIRRSLEKIRAEIAADEETGVRTRG